MDSDEDDEEPENEPETSSTSQTTVPVLPYCQGPAASSQGPAQFLVTKTVSIAMSIVHKVRTQEGLCTTEMSTF